MKIDATHRLIGHCDDLRGGIRQIACRWLYLYLYLTRRDATAHHVRSGRVRHRAAKARAACIENLDHHIGNTALFVRYLSGNQSLAARHKRTHNDGPRRCIVPRVPLDIARVNSNLDDINAIGGRIPVGEDYATLKANAINDPVCERRSGEGRAIGIEGDRHLLGQQAGSGRPILKLREDRDLLVGGGICLGEANVFRIDL